MVVTKKHHELYNELCSIMGHKYVSDDRAALLSYTWDMSPFPPGKPQGIVVRPGSVEEVVELVKLANQTRTPLVPIGGKATMSGVPPGQPGRGIVLDMKRMDKVIDIDEASMAVTIQCGITLGEMAARVNERGFDVPAAAVPIYANTVGGHLSGYASGGFGKYSYSVGSNGHYLLGMKVVLPDGSVVDTGTGEGGISTYRGHTWARGMHGPDLAGMFLADGGMFGIKVEATYRMFRLPKFHKANVRCWDTLDQAYQAFRELWEIDPYLYVQPYSEMILIGPECSEIIGAEVEPAWTLAWGTIGNSEEEVELKIKITDAICAMHGGRAAEPALATALETLFFESADMGHLAIMGQMPYFEVLVPRRDMLEAYKWAREYALDLFRGRGVLSDWSDVTRLRTVAIMLPFGNGCGVVDIIPFFDQNDRELNRIIYELMVEYFEQAKSRGYLSSGSQGHESRVRARSWTPEYYNYVLTLKKMLDPNNIMNPGVYFL